jgi:hypothetical protein
MEIIDQREDFLALELVKFAMDNVGSMTLAVFQKTPCPR